MGEVEEEWGIKTNISINGKHTGSRYRTNQAQQQFINSCTVIMCVFAHIYLKYIINYFVRVKIVGQNHTQLFINMLQNSQRDKSMQFAAKNSTRKPKINTNIELRTAKQHQFEKGRFRANCWTGHAVCEQPRNAVSVSRAKYLVNHNNSPGY